MNEEIRGTGSSSNIPPLQPIGPNPMQNAMDTPVRTLGDIKRVLIANLGEAKGKKLYNLFLMSFAQSMISQLRQTQQSADQATKQMSKDTPS